MSMKKLKYKKIGFIVIVKQNYRSWGVDIHRQYIKRETQLDREETS